MPDLSELQSAEAVKIAGVNPLTGIETAFAEVTSEGKLKAEMTADMAGRDAFGRLRISVPEVLISISHAQGAHDLLFNTTTASGGTAAFNAATSSLRLSLPTTNGASVIRQTRRYVRYNPGRSYIFTLAVGVGAKKANVTKRWGAFDSNNGYFFYQDGTNLAIGTRTNASGSVVDTLVNQSDWNIDKLDGTGASGITLDTTKHQLWVIDHLWHGAGPVRYGVHIAGKIYYVHQVLGGNTLSVPFIRMPILPLRTEITNTGTAANATTMDVVCVSATIENGSADLFSTYSFAASNGVTAKSVSNTQYTPLLSIRPKTTINGVVNRGPIFPESFDIATAATFLHIQFIVNPTLTGASFASVNSSSGAEFDTSATSATGGTVVYETYATSGGGKAGANLGTALDAFVLGLDIGGTVQDIFLIQARATVNNQATYSSLRWKEYQ